MSSRQSQVEGTVATLEGLGIEVDEVDAAVIAAILEQFGPSIERLLSVDLSEIEPEVDCDPSGPPR